MSEELKPNHADQPESAPPAPEMTEAEAREAQVKAQQEQTMAQRALWMRGIAMTHALIEKLIPEEHRVWFFQKLVEHEIQCEQMQMAFALQMRATGTPPAGQSIVPVSSFPRPFRKQ